MGVIDSSRLESLDFIRSMLSQLRDMARAERADMLAYLIDVASEEANDAINWEMGSRLGGEQRNGAA